MQKTLLYILVAILLAGGLYVLWTGTLNGTPETVDQAYENSTYGLSFSYPDSYTLEEREGGSRHSVVLMRTEDLPPPQNGEGPPAITVDIFEGAGADGVEAWVRGSTDSNFQLSLDGELRLNTLGTAEVASYTWDGLYRGESVVFAHAGNILMFSVTSLTPEDDIQDDFFDLLESLTLSAPGA